MISDFLNISTADVEEYAVHHAKDDDSKTHPNIKVAVEGNISSGKSTFLQAVGQLSENLRSTTQFIPEPVEMWTDHNGNIFEEFAIIFVLPRHVVFALVCREQHSGSFSPRPATALLRVPKLCIHYQSTAGQIRIR